MTLLTNDISKIFKKINCDLRNAINESKEIDITDIPSIFISRLYFIRSNKSALITPQENKFFKDFDYWIKLMKLFNLQFELKKYKDCQTTLQEMQDRFGNEKLFQSLQSKLINAMRDSITFLYNGKENVTWNELPLEIRKNDYPYYFDKDGNDCFPYIQN